MGSPRNTPLVRAARRVAALLAVAVLFASHPAAASPAEPKGTSALETPSPAAGRPADAGERSQEVDAPGCTVVAVGFDGGHILPEWLFRSTFGKLKDEIRALGREDICIHTYPGVLSPLALKWVKARPGARVVLYGYSSGGWTAVRFARRLKKEGIPVELLVQIDTPFWSRGPVPSNVRVAANFYQQRTWFPLLWGSGRLPREDPAATSFSGSIRAPGKGHFDLPNLPELHQLILTTVDTAWKAAHADGGSGGGGTPALAPASLGATIGGPALQSGN